MAACVAPAWPSQARAGRGNTSERHSALARMRERHARADRQTPELDAPAPRAPQQPRPPAQPRGSDARPGYRSNGGHSDMDSGRVEPWAPAWAPDLDDESPPPKPQRPVPPGEATGKSRPPRSEKFSDDGDVGRAPRVRGPAEVKTARDNEADDECLPPGAQTADFKTLHAMIARGIQDSETSAVKLEKDVAPASFGHDEEELRFRDRQRQRREQESAQREREREQARQKRRREQEERERRQAEELQQEEREELALREARCRAEAQCRKELAAAMRIQSRMRGRWSRMGKPSEVRRDLKAVLHWEPIMSGSMLDL